MKRRQIRGNRRKESMQNMQRERRDMATFKREMFNKDRLGRRRHYAKRRGRYSMDEKGLCEKKGRGSYRKQLRKS